MTLDVLYTVKPVPYSAAHARQREMHARRAAEKIPDTLWLLEHPPVITTGIRGGQSANILVDTEAQGIEVAKTERGGEVTYHGPGQLVGYLFVGIKGHGFRVKDFVRNLEGGFISYLKARHGIAARHDDTHTGVWVGMEKITAIGIALRRQVTLHGFAFNVNTNLTHFDWIIPCGIAEKGRGVTSLEKLLGRRLDLGEVAEDISGALRDALGYGPGGIRIEP